MEFSQWDSWGESSDYIPNDGYLFPNVASVSFEGAVNDTFGRYILSSTITCQLQHLRLLHFQIGEHKDTTILVLNDLAGKRTSLKSLTIIEDLFSLVYSEGDLGNGISAYIRLLESLRETLENFHLEAYIFDTPEFRSTPMEKSSFVELKRSIQAVLKHGDWPCLREATVKSVYTPDNVQQSNPSR